MNSQNQEIQDRILLKALEDIPFDGWHWDVIEQATIKAGYDADIAKAVFPSGLKDVLCHFSYWADRQMMIQLQKIDQADMRIRDRIKAAVATRFEVLAPYKESVRAASVYWLSPFRKIEAGKLVWSSADKIWIWAGDEATDYNYYTKRTLLSGIMMSTAVVWLNDKSDDHQETMDFLDRRIDNVLKAGQLVNKIKSKVSRNTKTQKG